MTQHSLSDTEYAVLGLLTFGERSGYELDKLARCSIGYFWRPAKSKIYAILPRLVERGFAERTTVAQTRRPDKQLYRLTSHGESALREWLDKDEPIRGVARDGLLLKVFFGAYADVDALRAQVAGRKIAGVLSEKLRDEVQYLQSNIRFVVMDGPERSAEPADGDRGGRLHRSEEGPRPTRQDRCTSAS